MKISVNRIVILSIFTVFAFANSFVALAKPKAGQKSEDFEKYKEFKLNADGYQTNAAGWIIRVDRNRVFDEFEVNVPVSTEKWPSGIVEDSEKIDEGLYPFEHVRVRKLVINGDAVSKKLGEGKYKYAFETVSLKGIEELSQIVIKGKIPKFEEKTKWWKKDDDWRRGLKRIVFENQVEGLTNISFLGEVKCIEFGTGTVEQICKRWGKEKNSECLKDLEKCYGLEQLVIPYCMATNTAIHWGDLIRNSPLKNREVVSFLSLENEGECQAVLLNIGASGEISDYVTTIRADSIPKDFRKSIRMPFRVRNVIGGKIPQNLTFVLKKGALLFSPDITNSAEANRLCESKGLIKISPVKIATAYCGLSLSNSIGFVASKFEPKGSSWASSISLLRGRNLENRIFAHLKLADVSYPVSITTVDGKELDSIPLIFKHEPLGWGVFLFGFAVSCIIISALFAGIWFWGMKQEISRKRLTLASCGVAIGIFVVFLGLSDIGVLQYYVDTYLTGTAISYLNSSFVSSLAISVSVTVVKLVVGFLQGLQLSLFVVGMNISSVFQPVQDVLEKISTYSWISTCVLAFVRIICQLLRDGAAFVWCALGSSLTVFSLLNLFGCGKGARWVSRIASVAIFLSLGIPIVLCCCAWLSCQLSDISGAAFNQAMTNFTLLAQSCSWESLKSMSAIQGLLSQFGDAVSGLISSAIYYIATKVFDCFLVPLMLYFGLKKSLKGFSDGREDELVQIRRILARQDRKVLAPNIPCVTHGESNSLAPLCVGTDVLPVQQHQGQESKRTCSSTRLPSFCKKLKPEWITAGSVVVLCLLLPITTLREVSVVVPEAGGATPVEQTISQKSESYSAPLKKNEEIGLILFNILAITAFLLFEYWCFRKAKGVCADIRENKLVTKAQDKLKMLNESSYWLDLPLYGGLGGTVLGFLIISIPKLEFLMVGGRIVAYMSTLLGIGATWWIQKKVVSPYKTKLMEQMAQEKKAHE